MEITFILHYNCKINKYRTTACLKSHSDRKAPVFLQKDPRFRTNPLLPFWEIDRYIKTSMIDQNLCVVAATGSKMVKKPTGGELKNPRREVYKRYGNSVAATIPGSKSLWHVAYLEVLAMSL